MSHVRSAGCRRQGFAQLISLSRRKRNENSLGLFTNSFVFTSWKIFSALRGSLCLGVEESRAREKRQNEIFSCHDNNNKSFTSINETIFILVVLLKIAKSVQIGKPSKQISEEKKILKRNSSTNKNFVISLFVKYKAKALKKSHGKGKATSSCSSHWREFQFLIISLGNIFKVTERICWQTKRKLCKNKNESEFILRTRLTTLI